MDTAYRRPISRPIARVIRACLPILATLAIASVTGHAAPPTSAPTVYAAEVDAIIQPVSAEFMIQTMDRADAAHAGLLVFTLRTPGGLVDATRDIITRMLRATTPVAVFIAPSGARAASAGFLLTIAADVAAMAPGTHTGAAHPVSGNGDAMDATTAKKAEEDLAAYARTLATARHRNVAMATDAVVASRAYTEQEARSASPPLVDVIAKDLPDLLRQLQGRTIRRFDGSAVELDTEGATVVPVAMSGRQRVLSLIAHPNVAYLLLSLGMLGLTIELWSPGAILPGVVGAVSLLLAAFALQLLPVNYAGLGLILLGLLLLALEIKVTSYGLLTIGGGVSLVFGSMMLFDASAPDLQLSLRFVVPIVVGFVAIAAFLVRLGLAAQRSPATTGIAGMIGLSGQTLSTVGPDAAGSVAVRGETWRATADRVIDPGVQIRVTDVRGLTLTVRPE